MIAYWVIEATKDGVEIDEHPLTLAQGSRRTAEDLANWVREHTPYGWYADITPRPLARGDLAELILA
jgi:hypothetical protein